MTGLLLSDLAGNISNDIEKMHRVQNVERIEAFCLDLIPFYRAALSDLRLLLEKLAVLRALASPETRGTSVVTQQGLALVRQTTEQALIDRHKGLVDAVCDYITLLQSYSDDVDAQLTAQRGQLRARLMVLYSLCHLLPHLFSGDIARIENLDKTLGSLAIDPFKPETWQHAAEQVQWLAGEVTKKLAGHLSSESADALTALAMGQVVPFASLKLRNFKELLEIPTLSEQLFIQMKFKEEQ